VAVAVAHHDVGPHSLAGTQEANITAEIRTENFIHTSRMRTAMFVGHDGTRGNTARGMRLQTSVRTTMRTLVIGPNNKLPALTKHRFDNCMVTLRWLSVVYFLFRETTRCQLHRHHRQMRGNAS
jgi:hypothetical protein